MSSTRPWRGKCIAGSTSQTGSSATVRGRKREPGARLNNSPAPVRIFRETLLDFFETIVNFAAKVLHEDAGQRHGRPRHQRKPGADAKQKVKGADGKKDSIGAVHEAGPGSTGARHSGRWSCAP